MANIRRTDVVELENEKVGKRPFQAAHAENILNATNNTGPGQWVLPKGSKFVLENGKLNRSATA